LRPAALRPSAVHFAARASDGSQNENRQSLFIPLPIIPLPFSRFFRLWPAASGQLGHYFFLHSHQTVVICNMCGAHAPVL
jgi:hypothetical protein